MEFDLSIGPRPGVPGFIGPIDAPERSCDGEEDIGMFEPIAGLPGFIPGIRPLLIRFDEADANCDGGGGGARGLKAGWPCEETRKGPEF